MDDAVLREGPTMKTVADDPVMDHSGFGLDGFRDREEACGCLLAACKAAPLLARSVRADGGACLVRHVNQRVLPLRFSPPFTM
jgi:hypothetical protein